MSDQLLIVKRRLPAGLERVFEALTQPEVMARWYFAGSDWSARVTGSPEVGGGYTVEMLKPDGDTVTMWGEYRELEPPFKVVFTWNTETVQDTIVTVELSEAGAEETDMVLYHALPEGAEMREMHNTGWNACLDNLEKLLGRRSA